MKNSEKCAIQMEEKWSLKKQKKKERAPRLRLIYKRSRKPQLGLKSSSEFSEVSFDRFDATSCEISEKDITCKSYQKMQALYRLFCNIDKV